VPPMGKHLGRRVAKWSSCETSLASDDHRLKSGVIGQNGIRVFFVRFRTGNLTAIQQLCEWWKEEKRKPGMPRYFFNIRHSDDVAQDLEGIEFASFEDATIEATETARELTGEAIHDNQPVLHSRIEICNEAGEVLGIVKLVDVIA
jgi:hypothetical protein